MKDAVPNLTNKKQREALAPVRNKINLLDQKIVDLLQERAGLSLEVAQIKSQNSTFFSSAIYDPIREQNILEILEKYCHEKNLNNLPQVHLKSIYGQIFSSSRALQHPQKIAYLGPKWTFSYYCAHHLFGPFNDFLPQHDFRATFQSVSSGESQYCVIPLENSLHGSVASILDLLFEFPLSIIQEHYLPIQHALISQENDLHSIKKIYSHSQGLAQCRNWLLTNLPGVEVIESSSTARAAQIASEQHGAAAIAHPEQASSLSLNILSHQIMDSPDNYTRFAVLAKKALKQGNHSSALFTLKNTPGALTKVLTSFYKKEINLEKLESRPLPHSRWEYIFFIDLGVNLYSDQYLDLLEEIKKYTGSFKILGSFSRKDYNMT